MQELSIYMVTHKSIEAPVDPYFCLIQAGSAVSPDLGCLRDDSGDNISDKNSMYSEMTAVYWIWKNSHAENVGIVHYRRLFSAMTQPMVYRGKNVASGADLLEQLSSSNCVVVQPLNFVHHDTNIARSVEQQYVGTHHGFDLLHCRMAVADLTPGYLPAFDFVMRNNQMVAFNMMIAPRAIFNEYCEWIFKIFFSVEERLPLSSKTGYQARVIAFLAERLSTVWLAHNRSRLRLDFRHYVFYDDV